MTISDAVGRGGTTFADPKMTKEIQLPAIEHPGIIKKLDQVKLHWDQLLTEADKLVLKNNNAKADTTPLVAKELSIASDRLQSILENFSTNPEKAVPRANEEKRNALRISNSIMAKIETEKKDL